MALQLLTLMIKNKTKFVWSVAVQIAIVSFQEKQIQDVHCVARNG